MIRYFSYTVAFAFNLLVFHITENDTFEVSSALGSGVVWFIGFVISNYFIGTLGHLYDWKANIPILLVVTIFSYLFYYLMFATTIPKSLPVIIQGIMTSIFPITVWIFLWVKSK